MTKEDQLTQDYIRVGIHYFKKVQELDEHGFSYTTLEKWSKETIKDDFANSGISRPHLKVPQYDVFCNVPDNSASYEQSHGQAYNIYQKPTHQAQEGEYSQTMKFLQHIYGKYLDFGLDYITILWRYPKQRLPIHCLVSQKEKTGKSTFLHWLQSIFQSNMAIIQNHDFEGQFNAHFATKNYLAIDETQMDLEKRGTSEKIKYVTTSPITYVNFKGVDKKKVTYYTKLFMNSNKEEDFVYIEPEDTRYFIRQVPKIADENPDFLEDLKLEIPAFLYFLENRTITHPRKSRLWFEPQVYQTEARRRVIENTKPKYQRVVDDFIQECFYTFNVEELHFAPKDIWEQVHDKYRHVDPYKIRDYFRKVKRMKPVTYANQKVVRYSCYYLRRTQNLNGEAESLIDYKDSKVGRPYLFKKQDWVEKIDISSELKEASIQKVQENGIHPPNPDEPPF